MTLVIALLLALVACIEPPFASVPMADAAPAFAIVDVRVTTRSGTPVTLGAAPDWPVIEVIASEAIAAPEASVFLVAADPADVADDLASAPLRASTRDAAVPIGYTMDGTTISLLPGERLTPGARYVVGVAAWASTADGRSLDAPFVAELHVREGDGAGARATDAWPADGTSGVPIDLALLAVRFEGDLDPARLRVDVFGPHGTAVAVDRSQPPCEEIGWAGGTCVALVPRHALATATVYRTFVPADVLDATGAPIGPWSVELVTASEPTPPIAFAKTTCAIDETSTGPACALADDDRIALRVNVTQPARLFAEGGGSVASAVAPRGDAVLELSRLGPSRQIPITLRAVDLAGRETELLLDASTTPRLAPLAITEVRADPRGPEPTQEYVEVLNSGAVPIDLDGFALADGTDREGDFVTGTVLLAAGARALFVADAFDPTHPDDPEVPGGVVLVRVGTSLGSAGLSNAGEPLFLRDPEGRRVSAAPATRAPGPGVCLVRIATDGRTGEPAAFAPDDAGACTPGR